MQIKLFSETGIIHWNWTCSWNFVDLFWSFQIQVLDLGYHEIKVLQKFTSPKHVCTRSSKNLEYFDPSENMVPMRLKEHHHPLSKPHKKLKNSVELMGTWFIFTDINSSILHFSYSNSLLKLPLHITCSDGY